MVLQKSDIDNVLKNYLKTENFEILSCEEGETDDITTGFLSAQNKICIKYKSNGNEGDLHIFIKGIPESSYHREVILNCGGFRKEVSVFEEVLSPYRKYLGENTVPACYLAKPDEIMLMEDITKKGFKNVDHYKTLDVHHCEKVLETMAKVHMLSIRLEEKLGCKMFDLIPDLNRETIMITGEDHIPYKMITESIRVLKQVSEKFLSNKFSEAERKKAYEFMDNIYDHFEYSKSYTNVIVQGDPRCGNIMFSYDEEGNVKNACIYDFQLAAYKPPAYDILLFLHTCTDRTFRDKYLSHLMKHYYKCFSEELASSGIAVEDKMTWEEFQGSLEEVRPVVLGQACLFLHFVLVPVDLLEDILPCPVKFKVYFEENRTEEIFKACENKIYRKRNLEALTDLIEYFNKN